VNVSNVLTFTVHDLVCGKENAKGIHINMSETMPALSLWQRTRKSTASGEINTGLGKTAGMFTAWQLNIVCVRDMKPAHPVWMLCGNLRQHSDT
jgi:hypothetical protein